MRWILCLCSRLLLWCPPRPKNKLDRRGGLRVERTSGRRPGGGARMCVVWSVGSLKDPQTVPPWFLQCLSVRLVGGKHNGRSMPHAYKCRPSPHKRLYCTK